MLINGAKDHVHLLFVLPASLALSDLMEKVKANSSKWVHEGWRRRRLFGWQEGYTAFSVRWRPISGAMKGGSAARLGRAFVPNSRLSQGFGRGHIMAALTGLAGVETDTLSHL